MKFVAFDGLDGSGKSVQINLFSRLLSDRGYDVVVIPSFSRNGFSGQVRETLLGKTGEEMNPLPRQMFIAASYLHTYHTEIVPALQAGKMVILDRMVPLSTVVYGLADGISVVAMNAISDLVMEATDRPDICFFLDVPYEVSKERIEQRTLQEFNHFDNADAEKFNHRRKWMRSWANDYPWVMRVDGAGSVEDVQGRITSLWDECLLP